MDVKPSVNKRLREEEKLGITEADRVAAKLQQEKENQSRQIREQKLAKFMRFQQELQAIDNEVRVEAKKAIAAEVARQAALRK